MAKIQSDLPKKRGEFCSRLPGNATRENAGESALSDVLSSMHVSKHADAKILNRFLPAAHELSKCVCVVVQLYAPHQLFVSRGKERFKKPGHRSSIMNGVRSSARRRSGPLVRKL